MTRGRLAGAAAAVVAATVAGVVVAGQGSGSPVAAAATKSANAGGAHVSFSLSLESPRLEKTIQVSGNGVVDGQGADITIHDTGAPASVPSSVHAILVGRGGDELAFVHVTPMPALAGGKSWVELDLSKLAAAHGLDLGALAGGAGALTPSQVLDLLRGAGASVTNVGSATVDGASTTHYRVLVDAAEIARVAGLPSELTDRLGSRATKQVPVDVWIGKDGLVHRVALDLHHGAGGLTFTATIGDYGADVSVAAPARSDVFDVTSLLTHLGGIRPLS